MQPATTNILWVAGFEHDVKPFRWHLCVHMPLDPYPAGLKWLLAPCCCVLFHWKRVPKSPVHGFNNAMSDKDCLNGFACLKCRLAIYTPWWSVICSCITPSIWNLCWNFIPYVLTFWKIKPTGDPCSAIEDKCCFSFYLAAFMCLLLSEFRVCMCICMRSCFQNSERYRAMSLFC